MSEDHVANDESIETVFSVSRLDEPAMVKNKWLGRLLCSAPLGGLFFRRNLSQREELMLAEFTYSAVTRAASSAVSFFLVSVFLAYLAFRAERPIHALIILAIGLFTSIARLALKRRFCREAISEPGLRRRAHINILVTTLLGTSMWVFGLVFVYPHLDANQTIVFLLLMVGSTTIGACFMTLAPPAYVLHISILFVTFVICNSIPATETSILLSALLGLFAYELYKVSYGFNTSSFRLTSRLAKTSYEHTEEQNKLQRQFIERNAKVVTTLRASAESRNLHLAKISHEFRHPLQIIVSTIELLSVILSKNQDKTVVSSIENLNSACSQLLASSSDLADYLKSNSTVIKLKTEKAELIELVAGCIGLYDVQAKEKGLELRFKHEETSIEYMVDAVRLRQILTNLIGNAVKYTTHGSICLECKKENDGRIFIVVRDTGSGISEDAQKSIFEPWFRADDTTRGMGLGLAIVKATADAIGAKVQIKSKLGAGTEVTLVLPPRKIKQPM